MGLKRRNLALGVTVLSGLVLTLAAARQEPGPSSPAVRKAQRQQFQAFLNLPPERQAHIRKLASELKEEDSQSQARLLRVLLRYSEWLDRLSPEERRRVTNAATSAERIAVIKKIQEEHWISTLPKSDRDELDRLAKEKNESERTELLAKLRENEAIRELQWNLPPARTPPDLPPARLQELQQWRQELMKKLTKEENEKLASLEPGSQESQDYIRTLQRKYKLKPLRVQGGLRAGFLQPPNPPVPNDKLIPFLQSQPDESRANFNRRFKDPSQRDQARAELESLYWKQHPDELKKAREEDERKRNKNRPAKGALGLS